MQKTAAGGGGGCKTMQQRCWAFLVICLLGLGSFFAALPQAEAAADTLYSKTGLVELDEDNWRLMLEGEWMVEFFAPWCPACKNLAPTWERFAGAAGDVDVNVAKIDVTTSPSLSGRFFVTALPTIYHVKDGVFRQYRGSRDGDALMLFIRHKQWDKLEPISAWKRPDTIHMSMLSYFFKLSHTLKDFNGRLQEEYGLPSWGSYALFAIGTIFVGAALGLMLVCVVDFLYPPKKSQRQSFSEAKESLQQNGIEDIANDEIEDDGPVENENDEDDEEEDEDVLADADDDEEDAEEISPTTTDEEDKHHTPNDSEEPESDRKEEPPKQKPQQKSEQKEGGGAAEVRKRKPRKAD